jgi:hypothetical protein
VDVHSGTCTDWVTEPIHDLGDMQVTNVGAEGDQEAGDVSGDVPEAAAALGPVYQVNNTDTDLDGAQLLEDGGEYVIAVHQSPEDYESLVACGNVIDFTQSGTLIVPLQPVGENNLTGMALIGAGGLGEDVGNTADMGGVGTAGFTAYLWQCEPVEVAVEEAPTVPPSPTATPTPTPEPSPTPTAEPSPTPTPEPSPTPEPTPTEVPTTVIETTEEVLAPTATALAQQDQMMVELGDESPGALTASVDQPLVISNTSDVERVFRIEELGIDEPIPAGEDLEIQFPDNTEAGDYDYQVLENDEPVFEDTLTIE